MEFGVYGDVCTYIAKTGENFDLRYVRREPEIAQGEVAGAYFADLEVLPADLAVTPRRGDEVEIGGVRYVVAKVWTPAQSNPLIALHRKADK